MRSLALPVSAGALFGAGLLVSGMTQPDRVTGFLDVAGRWNPTLAFVMLGAIFVLAMTAGMALEHFTSKFRIQAHEDVREGDPT